MSEANTTPLSCLSDLYNKSFTKKFPQIEIQLKEQVLNDGFELIKPTGMKKKNVYGTLCAEELGNIKKQGERKRSTISKRIGNYYKCVGVLF